MTFTPRYPHRRDPFPRRRTSFTILLMLVVATVSWRRGVFYESGLDPVVAAKAALTTLALAMAWLGRQACRSPRPVGGRTFWLLIAFVAISTFGSVASGQALASGVLAMRLLLLGVTLILLARTFPMGQLFRDLLAAMMVVGLVAAATGVGSIGAEGRLFGGIPSVHANEIALLCGLPLLGLAWVALQERLSGMQVVVGLVAFGAVWLSGSRTGLAAVLIALAVMLVQARRLKTWVAVLVALSIPAGIYAIFGSALLTDFVNREGDGRSFSTFESRTIAWRAAWASPETGWERWMGSGLSQKLITVRGQWWDSQVLDSSWASALVQGGLLGVLILAFWLVATMVASARCQWQMRMFLTAVMSYLIIRSVLESGMLDSTPQFLVLVLISLASDKWTRLGLLTEGEHRHGAASRRHHAVSDPSFT